MHKSLFINVETQPRMGQCKRKSFSKFWISGLLNESHLCITMINFLGKTFECTILKCCNKYLLSNCWATVVVCSLKSNGENIFYYVMFLLVSVRFVSFNAGIYPSPPGLKAETSGGKSRHPKIKSRHPLGTKADNCLHLTWHMANEWPVCILLECILVLTLVIILMKFIELNYIYFYLHWWNISWFCGIG